MFTNLGQLVFDIYNTLADIAFSISDNLNVLLTLLASVGIGLIIINLIINVIS